MIQRNKKDYPKESFLDYDYIKNHYRLIAVNLSRQEKLDAYLDFLVI